MFLRILLWSLIVFFLIRFLWRMFAPMFRGADQKASVGDPESGRKSVEYKDVQDAKFQDLGDEKGRQEDNRKSDS